MSKLIVVSISILIVVVTKTWLVYGDPDPNDKEEEKAKAPTFAGQYPFVGSLELVTTGSRRFLCVATAITETWVLTVYSCFETIISDGEVVTAELLDSADVKLKLPNFDLENNDIGDTVNQINRVLMGPWLGADRLVLLSVTTPISKELVSKVKVGSKDVEPDVQCVNVGWSPTFYPGADVLGSDSKLKDVTQKLTRTLTKATFPEDIKGHVVWGQTIKTDTSPDICKFETGSPFLCRDGSVWNLVGVAGNLGDGISDKECSTPDDYAQYILIKPYVTWMYTQMRKADKAEDDD